MTNNSPDTPLGRGCGKPAAILACIVGLLLAALFIAGWIEITGLQTFAENSGVNP